MLYHLKSGELYQDLIFFDKFILNEVFKANNKDTDIKDGKKRANNKLKFEI